jgi:predicted transcriptional regulator
MRTLIDVPDDDIQWLDRIAAERGKSRASMVREAISAYRTEAGKDWIARGAGYWKQRHDIGDAVEYQRAMREDRDDGRSV